MSRVAYAVLEWAGSDRIIVEPLGAEPFLRGRIKPTVAPSPRPVFYRTAYLPPSVYTDAMRPLQLVGFAEPERSHDELGIDDGNWTMKPEAVSTFQLEKGAGG